MKLIPLGEYVIVRRMQAEERTAGGIVLPDTAREKPQQGRVVAVGDGRHLPDGTRAEPQVAEGDRIIFSPYAAREIRIGDDEVLVLRESEILAVVE